MLVIFASCQNSWRGVTDGDFDDFGGGDPVPVLVGVGMTDFHTNRESLKEQDLYDAGLLVYKLIEEESHLGE